MLHVLDLQPDVLTGHQKARSPWTSYLVLPLKNMLDAQTFKKITNSDSLDWNDARLDIIQHMATPEFNYTPYFGNDMLAFLLAGSTLMEMHIDGGKVQNARIGPGSLQFLPRHTVVLQDMKYHTFEFICQIWQSQPDRFTSEPFHHNLGLYT